MLLTMARQRTLCPALDLEVALFCEGRLSRDLEATGVRVHRLPAARASRPQPIWGARRALAHVLRNGRFDRVICHAAWSQALFGAVVKRAGLSLVFWAHDAATGAHWTERLARRVRPDLAICNSRYTATSLADLYPHVPVVVLAAPVDTSPQRLSDAERDEVRRALETRPEAVAIVQVSRMEPWKGHSTIIDALGRLARARPDSPEWVWWVVGGPQRPEEAAYVESLAAAARAAGIADRVRWLGERTDVRRLLAAADVYCQVTAAPEPFGIAYVEALAAGLPVVASRAGGAVEIVDDSCAVLVPPGDAPALAIGLERLITDPEYRAVLASHAPARARQLCDPAAQLERLADALSAMSVA
jgi:glycosyltransferase involved in cell wall biosynthesis